MFKYCEINAPKAFIERQHNVGLLPCEEERRHGWQWGDILRPPPTNLVEQKTSRCANLSGHFCSDVVCTCFFCVCGHACVFRVRVLQNAHGFTCQCCQHYIWSISTLKGTAIPSQQSTHIHVQFKQCCCMPCRYTVVLDFIQPPSGKFCVFVSEKRMPYFRLYFKTLFLFKFFAMQ